MVKNVECIKAVECIPTIQGEGPDSGKRMLLVRFKYCNKNCSWCDTKLKVKNLPEIYYNLDNLQEIIDKFKLGLLITGGEPSFEKHISDTIMLLNNLKYSISNIETNGCGLPGIFKRIKTSEKNIHYIYSPKIFKMSDLVAEIGKTEKLKKYENVYIKLVYEDNSPIRKYIEYLKELNINNRIYLMPKGTTRDDLIKNSLNVLSKCQEYKFNFSGRMHIIYGFI